MDISNIGLLIGIVLSVGSHLVIVSSKISKFMGTTEQCLLNVNRRIDEVEKNHHSCDMKRRMYEVERKQGELRDEMPERLARIEEELSQLKQKVDEIKQDMKAERNRRDRRDTDL
jgi:cell shape-determining protein MreC